MSTGFEKACEAVLDVVNDSLERVIQCNRHFIEGASSTLMKWIRAVQPAVDGLGCPGMAQIRLRSDARWDGMKIVREILDPYSGGDADAPQTDPLQDIIIRAFTVAWGPIELAVITVHEQLAPLVDEYVHPGQERVFLLGAFNVICAYVQEISSMVLGQAVVPTQVVPGIWGARWGILTEAPLLAPQIGPVAPPAQPTEAQGVETTEKAETGTQAEPAPPPTATPRVRLEQLVAPLSTKSPMKTGKSKGAPGSTAKRLYIQQTVRAVWADPEWHREDEQFECNRAQSRSVNIPVMVLADETAEALLAQQQAVHQSSTRPVMTTTAPKPAASATGTPSSEAVDAGAPAPWERFRKPSPTSPRPSTVMVPMPAAIQLPPARKRDRPAPPDPNDVIVVKDDDEPLSRSNKPKGRTKKA